MFELQHIIAFVLAYLIGSIPTAVIIGRVFYSIDVREYGSGNAGATNTFRVLGKKAGIPVLFLDVLKGSAAVLLAKLFTGNILSPSGLVNLELSLGIAAILGHVFPLYVGFRGGKGIATLLGVMLAVQPDAALMAAGVFLLVFILTRFVSLGSMIAALSFPVIVIVIYKSTIPSLIIFSIFIAILVLITHQKNIERLIRREENRAKLSFRKSSDDDEDVDDDD